MKSRKGALEFSMSFLITVILGVVIIVLGIILISKLVSQSEQTQKEVDQELEAQLNSILSAGKITAVVPSIRNIGAGSTAYYAVGIENLLGSDADFRINVTFKSAVDKDGELINIISSPNSWLVYTHGNETVMNNNNLKRAVAINVPKREKSGTYIFDVEIFYYNTTSANYVSYGSTVLKMYLNIK